MGRGIWGWSETVGSSMMDISLVSRVAWLLQGRGIFISSLEVETAFHHNTYLVAAPQEFHLKGFSLRAEVLAQLEMKVLPSIWCKN
jgi:hypothetical protein